jgi:predicted nucleic acid-binding protein
VILVDSNVILDLWDRDPVWFQWSQMMVVNLGAIDELAINPIIYADLAPRFNDWTALDRQIEQFPFLLLALPQQAAFAAGKAHQAYRRQGGAKTGVLADFFIGAHAEVLACPILTRDTRRYATYFPTVHLITP